MGDKLLPCPFCGCTKIPVHRGNGIGDVWLECTECEASTRLRENIQTCVKDWNRRAASPAAQMEDVRNLLTAASHALRSYQYGNAAPDLAESIANRIDAAMSASKEGA